MTRRTTSRQLLAPAFGRRLSRVVAIAMLLALFAAPSSFAWGEKGHLIVNDAATHAVPTEMPRFFHDAYARLVYLGPDPDRWRGAGPSLDAVNPPNHYLDYEYVAGLDLPRNRYDYLALLESSGTLKKFGISMSTPGFLPWEIAEQSELLTQQWRLLRNPHLSPVEREQIQDNIIAIAGTLGHYAGDASNPHHTTINYNGWLEANPNGYRNDCSTHWRFETAFVTRAVDENDVVADLSPPHHIVDYFEYALAFIRHSNSLVEKLYQIDRDGGFDLPHGTAEGRSFAEHRLAEGASFLRDLWWSTWLNSKLPPKQK